MIKRSLMTIVLLFFMSMLAGCGGSGYSDVIEVNNRFIEIMNDYATALEKATDADSVASAMNQFADKIEKIAPEMKEMAEKYPELKNEDNLPEELKVSQQQAEEAGKKMAGSFMKVMPHMMAPEVQAAQKRIASAMQTMM